MPKPSTNPSKKGITNFHRKARVHIRPRLHPLIDNSSREFWISYCGDAYDRHPWVWLPDRANPEYICKRCLQSFLNHEGETGWEDKL